MELYLTRVERTDKSTIGNLTDAKGVHIAFILEDKDRGLHSGMSLSEIAGIKVHGKTAIPTGRYRIVKTMSNRFKRMLPLLENVPGYAGIRIHAGNKAEDTEGCLLPGRIKSLDFVGESRPAFTEVDAWIDSALKKGDVFITVR
jgi:hypothetical protein